MEQHISDKIHKINCLISEIDALYHQAAVKLKVSDSVLQILYTIHDRGESCLLSDICRQSGLSKQTVNSSMRKLEEQEILFLEPYRGKSKKVVLTEKGRDYLRNTAERLYEAECSAFKEWTEEEIDTHIRLLEKYGDSFRKQMGGLKIENEK